MSKEEKIEKLKNALIVLSKYNQYRQAKQDIKVEIKRIGG